MLAIVTPTALMVFLICMMFHTSYKINENRNNTVVRCERCERLEEAIDNVLVEIYTDNPDYYLDILCEGDAYCNLQSIIMESHEKKEKVFNPDKQSPKP